MVCTHVHTALQNKWSQLKKNNLLTLQDSKEKTNKNVLCKTNKITRYHVKVLIESFRLDGHTLKFNSTAGLEVTPARILE